MVETNHLRGGILVEVAPNRIADLVSQTVEIIGFCHDGRTHSPGDVPPFRGFLYDKYELGGNVGRHLAACEAGEQQGGLRAGH